MVYSLLTKKIERKNCPLFWPGITATRLFLAECPHRRHGRNLFSCPEQWNPYFPLSWQTTSLSQEDSTGDSHTPGGIPYFSFKYYPGPSWTKINRLRREEGRLSRALQSLGCGTAVMQCAEHVEGSTWIEMGVLSATPCRAAPLCSRKCSRRRPPKDPLPSPL